MKINIKDYVAKEKQLLKNKIDYSLIKPSLLILQYDNNLISTSYAKKKMEDAKDCGIEAVFIKANSATTLLHTALSNMKSFDGVVLQKPHNLSFAYVDKIFKEMKDCQDVSGMRTNVHNPCIPKGIMEIIAEFYPKEDIAGEIAVVVGEDELVAKPLLPLLMEKGCTVISCNSKTADLAKYTKMADIVVSAVGKEKLITRDMLKDGAFVIDAGIRFDENGELCGDCDKAIYDDEQIAITTVPDGVDLITRLILMKNTFEAFKIKRTRSEAR